MPLDLSSGARCCSWDGESSFWRSFAAARTDDDRSRSSLAVGAGGGALPRGVAGVASVTDTGDRGVLALGESVKDTASAPAASGMDFRARRC